MVALCDRDESLSLFKPNVLCKILICCGLFVFTAFLTGCLRNTPDGPPDFYVDETKIPNAVPKREPLAKYGNMPFYYVDGKRYAVMQSAYHYQATGTASWYGTKFHTHRTSSGEPYNMLAMTGAHKTLPLPTYVEVTNLRNHRQVIVKVNDRGPFSGNRLIDLSYVAAKKLGMIGHGTTLVHVRAIDVGAAPSMPWHPTWYAKRKAAARSWQYAHKPHRTLSPRSLA